jgi:hypothetical protein
LIKFDRKLRFDLRPIQWRYGSDQSAPEEVPNADPVPDGTGPPHMGGD